MARVLLVATHPDTSRTPRTPQGNYISCQAERLLTQLSDRFGTQFQIHQQVLVVDAHVSNSPGIRAIKSYLADAKQKVLQVQILNQFFQYMSIIILLSIKLECAIYWSFLGEECLGIQISLT